MGESQEDTSEHDCQKCGKEIQQVPYKYAGKYFHARCLTCNYCSKKLAGKPFLCVEHKIFCGDQCQDNYQEPRSSEAATTANISNNASNDTDSDGQSLTNGHSQGDESLLEALNSTETTPSASPLPQTPPRGVRITDYPGHTLSQSPPGSIRRSSLSVSESSLTGSFTSDAGSPGQPRKRILKKPHGPRKHKSNRVHWNIPEEGGGDGVSLLSFESTSTTSGVSPSSYLQGVSECRRNWREFEEPPAPGSTGLTPMKQLRPPPRKPRGVCRLHPLVILGVSAHRTSTSVRNGDQ
ncbi:hypothetical protein GBAR_LOCUS8538 [Geodia barretti]|uniref:LIM zinc-binding domain-containing protein n=1 Tax=Geodia barretti TaxID=519541 RepID=A0AA35RNR6_GEOBA|nr:hypothetical protein GBAR_LOCUS8538 [Geodia barretti]